MKEKKGEGIPNIVIPTIRSVEFFKGFLLDWKEDFKGCHIIVIEDRKKKELKKLFEMDVFKELSYDIYDWRDIDKDLGDKAWIIPRKSDCVRSYGYYKAWQNNPLFIVTLDDDVRPQASHIENFHFNLFQEEYAPENFYNTLRNTNEFPRGTYKGRVGCDVSHGCWLRVPDLSAEEQIKSNITGTEPQSSRTWFNIGLIPKGAYFSMCGMNLAWKPHVTKDMYFGLQGGDYPIDRCGDIWAGYNITNKGYSVYTGYPMCTHTRASNVWSNLKKEENAEEFSKTMIWWLKNKTPCDNLGGSYLRDLSAAYKIWEGLFK